MKRIRSIEDLPIDSTKLCCNFINTVYSWNGEGNYDFLSDYDTFIDWCFKLSVSGKEHLTNLRHQAENKPSEAVIAITRIREIRLIIHSLVSAIAKGDKKDISEWLGIVNPLIAGALAQINIEYSESIFAISYQSEPVNLLSPVWMVLKSLYDLLTEGNTVRIKECPTCGWLFFDETKNGKRRWCNPLNCGTKDKMSRYNRKLKAQNDG